MNEILLKIKNKLEKILYMESYRQDLQKERDKEKIEKILFENIKKQKATNPLIGVQLGAKELVQILMNASKNDKGVHIDSLLGLIGSLAGFSCQMAIRESFVKTGKATLKQVVMEVGDKDGRKYYFGDLQNECLLTNKYSVWVLVGGTAQHLGLKSLPDINEMVAYTSSVVGGEEFGKPRLPNGREISDLPINYVKHVWSRIIPTLNKFCSSPLEWPVMLGLTAQEIMTMGKDAIDAASALTIVMECAIPASKFDPVPLGIEV